MKAFDARCHNCDNVHLVWVQFNHEPGDGVKIAHKSHDSQACGEYCEHTLVSQLDGLDHKDKWGPRAEVGG